MSQTSQPKDDDSLLPKPIQEDKKKYIKHKIWQIGTSFLYFYTFISLGLAVASLGWSTDHFAKFMNTTVDNVGYVVTIRNVGYSLGSFLGGKVLDYCKFPTKWYHFSGHKFFFIDVVVMSCLMVVLPLISKFWIMMLVMPIFGFTCGVLDVGINLLIVYVWGKRVNPWMQAAHFCYGVGSVASPFVAAQFLTEDISDMWPVQKAYWTLAVLCICAAFGYFFFYSPTPPTQEEETGEMEQTSKTKWWKFSREVQIAILLGIFLGTYVGAETGFGTLIFHYAHDKKIANVKQSAYLSSGFWFSLSIGRLLSILTTSIISPRTTLFIDIIGCVVGLIIMLIFNNSLISTWIGTVLVGLFMSSQFPTVMTFPTIYYGISVTGKMTGIMVTGGCIGQIFIPWAMFSLLRVVGPNSMLYGCLFIFTIASVVLILLVVLYKRTTTKPVVDVSTESINKVIE